MKNLPAFTIRNEEPADYRAVEELTREAFWNLYVPGADEHYLAHVLRTCDDFLPALDFVAVAEGQIIGHIMFSRSYILGEGGARHDVVTFGPVSVRPDCQGRGVGGALIRHAIGVAADLGHRAILIHGDPAYYGRFGFVPAKTYGITNPEGRFPAAHQALELFDGALRAVSGMAFESDTFHMDAAAAAAFDRGFPPKEKCVTPSQARFLEISGRYL